MLVDWAHAIFGAAHSDGCSDALIARYASWYPPEILKGTRPLFGTDIQMSASCMLWLLGGDLQTKRIPDSVPAPIEAFLHGCLLPGKRAPQNAWTLKEELDELIGKLWGKRKFHPFFMK